MDRPVFTGTFRDGIRVTTGPSCGHPAHWHAPPYEYAAQTGGRTMSSQSLIDVLINGETRSVPAQATVSVLVREMGFDPADAKGMAVAVNDTVAPKGTWDAHAIRSGDRIEVIAAQQGG